MIGNYPRAPGSVSTVWIAHFVVGFPLWSTSSDKVLLLWPSGGLGLPNLTGYYWAANVHKIVLWFTSPPLSWLQIEIDSCPSTSLQALACSPLPLQPSSYAFNPIVTGTLRIWAQIRRHFGWLTAPQSTPLCGNHRFIPVKIDPPICDHVHRKHFCQLEPTSSNFQLK